MIFSSVCFLISIAMTDGEKLTGITDYRGGDNPILIILFFLFLLTFFFFTVLHFVYAFYHTHIRLNRRAKAIELSSEEMNQFLEILSRIRLPNRGFVLEKSSVYDLFSQKISDFHIREKTAFIKRLEEAAFLRKIRHKAQLIHSFFSEKLHTSLSLPKNYPITLVYIHKRDGKVEMFACSVAHNCEFFLGVTQPKEESAEHLLSLHQPNLEVWFYRKEAYEYQFSTQLLFKEKRGEKEEPIWYLKHAHQINKALPQTVFSLPIKFVPKEQIEEIDFIHGTVTLLKEDSCKVEVKLQGDPPALSSGQLFLCRLTVEKKPLPLEAMLEDMQRAEKKILFQFSFPSLEEKTRQKIIGFLMKRKEFIWQD